VDVGDVKRLPGLPAVGLRDRDGRGDALAIDGEVEDSTPYVGGDAHVQGVGSGAGDFDGVVEPVAWVGRAYVETAAGVGRGFDGDRLAGTVVGSACVSGGSVPVPYALASRVEVFSLYQARDGGRGSAEGSTRSGRHDGEPVEVTHAAGGAVAIKGDLHDVLAGLELEAGRDHGGVSLEGIGLRDEEVAGGVLSVEGDVIVAAGP
jgi:hypothetical protein